MGIEAQQADGWLVRGIVTQSDPAQPSRIGDDELAPVVEDELQLREARRPRVVGPLATRLELDARATGRGVESTGHSEVQTRPRPAVELEPQVLAVPLHRAHAPAEQR